MSDTEQRGPTIKVLSNACFMGTVPCLYERRYEKRGLILLTLLSFRLMTWNGIVLLFIVKRHAENMQDMYNNVALLLHYLVDDYNINLFWGTKI